MTEGTNSHLIHAITACHECDLLLREKNIIRQWKTCCPRCGAVLRISCVNSMERTLALSITGLLLVIPANILPILTLELLGQSNTNTMINGIYQMAMGGYWWMSILVCFCSILAPIIKLLMLSFVSAGSLYGWPPSGIAKALKVYQNLDEWGMFDVYMLGILISFIKMKDMGTLIPGFGLATFVALLLVATVSSTVFDKGLVWARLGSGSCDDEDVTEVNNV